MKFKFLFILFLIISIKDFAQNLKLQDEIQSEGKKLYQSENASWNGTDIFLEQYKDSISLSGGYFSYADSNKVKNVFFSKAKPLKILFTVTFDSTFSKETAFVDKNQRDLTVQENEIFLVRQAAIKLFENDTFFETYKNTGTNFIPLIEKNENKVYILTSPKKNNQIIFGNDYLLKFDKKNNIISKIKLHRNLISASLQGEKDEKLTATYHTHTLETGEYITATDVCTLMLYGKFAQWRTHYVMSDNLVNIWDCDKNILVVITKKAWERINKDQQKKK